MTCCYVGTPMAIPLENFPISHDSAGYGRRERVFAPNEAKEGKLRRRVITFGLHVFMN